MKDFQTDTVPRPLVKAAAAGLLPEWVQALPVPDRKAHAHLSKEAFADPGNRLLPIHSKECVLWSATYAGAYPSWYPEKAASAIRDAAVVFNVTDIVEPLLAFGAQEEIKQAAAVQEKAAFAIHLDDGAPFGLAPGPLGLLPCHDEFHIDGSAESLNKAASANTMPPELVYIAAQGLVKAAAAKGCSDVLPRAISNLGVERMPDWNRAEVLLGDRFKAAGENFSAYRELAQFGRDNPESANEVIDGFRDLDTEFGFTYWGSKQSNVISPWEAVYSGPLISDIEKMSNTHAVLAGLLVPMDVLASFPDERIDKAFGKEAGERIKAAKAAPDNAAATGLLLELPSDVQDRLFRELAA